MYAMSIARTPTSVNNYFHSRNEATANRNHDQHTHYPTTTKATST